MGLEHAAAHRAVHQQPAGQQTTRTDGEGNVYVTVRYAQNDPEGAAQYLVPSLSNKQYGFVKETHVDVDPAIVMTLLGPDADLVAFTGNIIARTNTPGVFQDLVTRYRPSGTAGSGCAGCAYDPLGNPLAITDPRNNTTTFDRNELGEAYRTTSPAPYYYQTETTGSSPASLVTTMAYDFNQNLVKITKPLTNTIEYDYDERNLKIAIRVGGPTGSVTIMAYDGNKKLTDVIGPATRGTPAQTLSAVIGDAFGGSANVTFSGDWVVENFFDGFDRNISAVDAAGGMVLSFFDPGGRAIAGVTYGSPGGPTPTDRTGSSNVLLASSESRFDEAGRQYEAQRDVFLDAAYYTAGPAGLPSGRTVTHTGGGLATNSTANNHTATVVLTAGGTSYVLERTVFDRADRVTGTAADNGAITTVTLDGAGRKIETEDALGNILRNTFDGNGNVIFTTRIEMCTISSSTA
jgi:YD repeat-containing protein